MDVVMDKGIIYCLTSPSGKKYVGQTKRSLEQRIKEHMYQKSSCLIHRAIAKYGINNLVVECLQKCNIQDLDSYERHYMNELNTMHPNGYNIRSGGSESKQKMREKKLGSNNHNYGKPRTDETKQNISLAKTKENHHFFGKQLNIEHVQKLSLAHRKREEDKNLPMYVVYVKARPSHYQSEGYAVVNHRTLPNKYFISKNMSIDQKLRLAIEYLATNCQTE